LSDVPGNVTTDIHHRVPAAVAERVVVTRIPVADKPNQFGEQLRPGLSPAEQGHLGTSAHGVLYDGPAHERRAAKNKDSHTRRHCRSKTLTHHGVDALEVIGETRQAETTEARSPCN